METTYTIIATDGNQYGPITLAQLQTWIQEVRVAPDTQILRSDLNQWHPASHYQELNLTAAPAAPGAVRVTLAQPAASAAPANPVYAPAMASPAGMANAGELMELDKKIRNHGSWYFWIAGLTLVNTVTILSGSNGAFLLGLSITQVFEQLCRLRRRGRNDGGAFPGCDGHRDVRHVRSVRTQKAQLGIHCRHHSVWAGYSADAVVPVMAQSGVSRVGTRKPHRRDACLFPGEQADATFLSC